MKKRIKTFVSCMCILLAFALLTGFLQALVMPKYQSASREGALVREYYKNTTHEHDVLFIGDCEVYENFTPPTLWDEYGITSYIRGSAQQLTWQSYYLLEEMLEKETPRAVVFNVLALKYGEGQNEAYNRMTLDGMKWSPSKIKAIFASMTEEESFLSYLFPILRFHSRWKELTQEDFDYIVDAPTLSYNGYLMQTGIKGGYSDDVGSPLADYTLPQTSMHYLDKMRALCQEKGVELILIKAPTNHWKYYWYEEWDAQVADYANANNLKYYNLIDKAEEIGIDWSTDTYDGGVHLNVYGAEKLTSYFGKILKETLDLPDHRGDDTLSYAWEQMLLDYQRERNQQK